VGRRERTPPAGRRREIQILDEAEQDLQDGREFTNDRKPAWATTSPPPGRRHRFAHPLAGIHPMGFGFHRALSKRFPFGIYYLVEDAVIHIYAVLDLRRDPAWIRRRLTTGAQ